MTIIIISTIVFISFTMVMVFLGIQKNPNKQKVWIKFFVGLCVLYAFIIVIEKYQDTQQIKSLQSALEEQGNELDSTKSALIEGQKSINNDFKHLSLATLDLITPTIYKNFVNFRLGLMWYWIGQKYESEYHFRHTLRKYPNNIATKFNLAVILALNKEYDEASNLLDTIPKSIKSYYIIKEWKFALERAKEIGYIKLERKYWRLWQLPYME